MSTLLAALARIGDTWDGTTTSIRAAPRHVRCALAVPRHRRAGVTAAILVLILYTVSIGDVAFSSTGKWANAPLLQTAPDNLLATRAPYLFEPVLAVHPGGHVVVFFSPMNLLLGGIVAALAGCNIAVAGYAAQRNACHRRGYGRVLGAMPAFLVGFACCTPTLLLALGTGTSAAILPLLLPLRPFFYPLTLALLTGALIWGVHRAQAPAPPRSPSRAIESQPSCPEPAGRPTPRP